MKQISLSTIQYLPTNIFIISSNKHHQIRFCLTQFEVFRIVRTGIESFDGNIRISTFCLVFYCLDAKHVFRHMPVHISFEFFGFHCSWYKSNFLKTIRTIDNWAWGRSVVQQWFSKSILQIFYFEI